MKEKETNEIVNPEVQLEIDSMFEEYEIELRKELDLSKANSLINKAMSLEPTNFQSASY